MNKVPDEITLQELCAKAAQALARAGMQHRIDIYRDVEVDDPAVRMMLGRSHRVRIRVKITAASLLFENDDLVDGSPIDPVGSPAHGVNGSANGSTHASGNSSAISPAAPTHGASPSVTAPVRNSRRDRQEA